MAKKNDLPESQTPPSPEASIPFESPARGPALKATIHAIVSADPKTVLATRKEYWLGTRSGRDTGGTVVPCPFEVIDIGNVSFRKDEPFLVPVPENPNALRVSDYRERGSHVFLTDLEADALIKRSGEKVMRLTVLADGVTEGRILNVLHGKNDAGIEIPNPAYIRDVQRDVPIGRFLFIHEQKALPPDYRKNFDPPPMAD